MPGSSAQLCLLKAMITRILKRTANFDLINFVIIALAALGIALGSLVYFEIKKRNNITANYAPQRSIEPSNFTFQKIFSSRKGNLTLPGKDATAEEMQVFMKKAQELAEEAKFLDVSRCRANPEMFKTGINDKIILKNNDTSDRVLQFNGAQFVVPAGGEKEAKIDFMNRAGVYGFGCDLLEKSAVAGFLFVTN